MREKEINIIVLVTLQAEKGLKNGRESLKRGLTIKDGKKCLRQRWIK